MRICKRRNEAGPSLRWMYCNANISPFKRQGQRENQLGDEQKGLLHLSLLQLRYILPYRLPLHRFTRNPMAGVKKTKMQRTLPALLFPVPERESSQLQKRIKVEPASKLFFLLAKLDSLLFDFLWPFHLSPFLSLSSLVWVDNGR